MKWTLALSWGPSGGVYLHPRRICLWKLALTLIPRVEIDDLMEDNVEWMRLRDEADGHRQALERIAATVPADPGLKFAAGIAREALAKTEEDAQS